MGQPNGLAGLSRRRILGGLGGGLAAAWAGVLPSPRRNLMSQGDAAVALSTVWIDFDFPKAGMPLRRVLLNNRAVGKITAWNGRRFGVVPNILSSGKVEVAVYDLAHRVSPNMCVPKLLKRLTLPVAGEIVSVDTPDDQGFRLKVSYVTRKPLAPGELALPGVAIAEGEAFDCGIDCCVHCSDDPPGHDTCGGAVCCNIPCGPPCGSCNDPGANPNPCDPPPG